jgi:hypothetical protein
MIALRPARVIPGIFLGVALLGAPSSAFGDGGTVRASAREHGLRVTVFTSPAAPRAGPLDVSVLVQDADTDQPLDGVQVRVRATSRRDPTRVIERQATKDVASNKLLYAAVLDVPRAGWWEFRIRVEGHGEPAEVVFGLEVGEPLPGWVSWLGWVAWPVVAVVVFAIHRALVRRKSCRIRHP